MFSKAIEKAEKFIRPVVICKRYYNGEISTDAGTLVVINKDGWFVSCAHLFEIIPLSRKHTLEIAEYAEKTAKLQAENRTKELKKLHPNKEWLIASSLWTGTDGQKIVDLNVLPDADILTGRLDPFDPQTVAEYPYFKNPKSPLKIGTSLCKLGYAFTEIKADYDKAQNKFNLDLQNVIPFPLDGIYTRNILFKTKTEKNIEIKFIETSSPGLKGHSGCPVFDTDGSVWGIQSRTVHIPLGFNPVVERAGKKIEENQFLNAGWAIHPEVTAGFLTERKIEFLMK